MKPRFRQSMNWLHTWAGFVFAWLMYFIFVTGSTGYFENEIDRWMQPEMAVVKSSIDNHQVLDIAEQSLHQVAPDSPEWYISFPATREPFIGISWLQLTKSDTTEKKQWHQKHIDPDSHSLIDTRETAGGKTLYRMHYNLHYVPKLIGYVLTSLAAMLMLIGLVTGVVIHKKIFIEFFTFRPNKGGRSWLDIHNIFSVLPLPFHLMITYSGLLLLMGVTMSSVIDVTYGEGKIKHKAFYQAAREEIKESQTIALLASELSPKAVFDDATMRFPSQKISYVGIMERGTPNEHYDIWFDHFTGIELASSIEYTKNDDAVELVISRGKKGNAAQVYDVLEHLHEGLFADIYLRWLYFISGLLGAGMIATGMILWVLKRYKKPTPSTVLNNTAKSNQSDSKISDNKNNVIGVIDKLNNAVFIGIPIAVAGYLYSNRLLPIEMAFRADWEVHCFFITWLACVISCFLQPSGQHWKNMLKIAAIAYVCLPILNAITTEHNLISSMQQDDWIMAGVDLSLLMFALIFYMAARVVSQKKGDKITTDPGSIKINNEVLST